MPVTLMPVTLIPLTGWAVGVLFLLGGVTAACAAQLPSGTQGSSGEQSLDPSAYVILKGERSCKLYSSVLGRFDCEQAQLTPEELELVLRAAFPLRSLAGVSDQFVIQAAAVRAEGRRLVIAHFLAQHLVSEHNLDWRSEPILWLDGGDDVKTLLADPGRDSGEKGSWAIRIDWM